MLEIGIPISEMYVAPLVSCKAILSNEALRRRALERIGFVLGKPFRRRHVARSTRHIFGPKKLADERPVVFCCFKNAAYHIRAFIEHHRELGFQHFVLMDNGSTDGTTEIVTGYSGVTLFQSTASFGTHQVEMREYLLHRFGRNRWCLMLDVDEHFRWYNAPAQSLGAFTKQLEQNEWNAVVAHMVDVFGPELPDKKLPPVFEPLPLDKLRARYPYFTADGLMARPYIFGTPLHGNKVTNSHIPCLYGGIRKMLFDTDDFLTKHPFFHYSDSVRPLVTSPHTICGARIANFSAVLLHYKLVDNFYNVVCAGLESGAHINVESNYLSFKHRIEKSPLSISNIRLEKVDNSEALKRAGFYQPGVRSQAGALASESSACTSAPALRQEVP